MRDTDIIDALRTKLAQPGGRHLYGVLGSYRQLEAFAKKLNREAKTPDGKRFPKPLNVNLGILKEIPDEEFRQLVENEAKRPEPTAAHVAKAFESFLRKNLGRRGLLVLSNLELLFAYRLELNHLRTMAADDYRVVLLLPGKRSGGNVALFPNSDQGSYTLPTNLIADNHLWELRD